MLVKCGSVANSPFRVNAYINSMNRALNSSAVVALRSVYVHYIQPAPGAGLDEASGKDKVEIIDQILTYDAPVPSDDVLGQVLVSAVSQAADQPIALPDSCYLVQVVPRPGTISPWSSKATNILHN